MTSQPNEPEMTAEEAIAYIERLCDEENQITDVLEKNGRYWVAESETKKWRRNTAYLRMAIKALRRQGELETALKSLHNECVAAGFEDAKDFGWPNAMKTAKAALKD